MVSDKVIGSKKNTQEIEMTSFPSNKSKDLESGNIKNRGFSLFSWKEYTSTALFYLGLLTVIYLFLKAFCIAFPQNVSQVSNDTIINQLYLSKLIYYVGIERKFGCTAFLISNSLLLTAAHCLQFNKNISIAAVHIGGTRANNYEDMIVIPGSQLHYEHDYNLDDGDFATIVLENPIVPTQAVHPINLAPRNSKLPKTLKFAKWISNEPTQMDFIEVTVSVIDRDECLNKYSQVYSAMNKTVDFYGIYNTHGRTIAFCTDGGFIDVGNSGTPLVATDENGSVYGLLSRGPVKGVQLTNIFVDVRAFIDQLPGYKDDSN